MNQVQTEVILGKIRTGPYQARKVFDVTELRGLARTIKAEGLLYPPTVMAVNNHYELIAGDRRRRALFALALEESGVSPDEAAIAAAGPLVDSLPDRYEVLNRTVVTVNLTGETDPATLRFIGTVENLQRSDLLPTEKARGFQSLLDGGLAMAEVVERTGCTKSQIQPLLDLLTMPEQVRAYVDAGRIPLGALKPLAQLPAELQAEVADKMAGRTLVEIRALVRLVESRLKIRPATPPAEEDTPAAAPPEPAIPEITEETAPPKPLTVREQLAEARQVISLLTMQLYLDSRLLDRCAEVMAECAPDSRLTLMAGARAKQIQRSIKSARQPVTPQQMRNGATIQNFIAKRQRRGEP